MAGSIPSAAIMDPDPSETSAPSPDPPKNAAKAWLRFFVWLTPSVLAVLLVPVCLSVGTGATGRDLGPLLWFIGLVGGTYGIGWYDSMLSYRRLKDGRPNSATHAFVFTLLQILIVPAVVFTVLFSYCLFNPMAL